ncbi:DNA-binding transcriptional regulator, AcrR family [Catalinimonas alkaloidigena]|uniref:Biofilm operon icaADBC HTH-type negative transcriptional regulator IcaR n=1 Tax=Catalinimonas alkaloidigena TaxID=1075417 RepID=A0A1G9P1Q4_9BACT|nr:TetR family transcriptional regulator C-terminal domain-containing protein [Catalinimonas alkaloidigena]SDL92786.1 DNA-binding transcriptional regulator, AcrR family [Catalinimonas alkaloidigena]
MGRKSLKDERQKKIIKAFYRVAKKEGIENTSFAKVAKVLEMPPSLLVHYVNSKEELLLGLIDFILEKYRAIYQPAPQREGDALERLVSILDNIFSRKWNRLIDDGVFYSCFALVFRDPRIRTKFRELHLVLRQWLAETIQACMDQGVLTVQDATHTADLIFVISDGAYYYLSLIDDEAAYQERLQAYRQEAFRLLQLDELNVPSRE